MVIAVLGAAVMLVFGCLGSFALTYLMEGPSERAKGLEPIDRATAVISETRLPRQTATTIPPTDTSAPPLPTSLATSTPPRVPAASLIEKIDHADGYDWRSATRADRTQLCRWLAGNELRAMGNSPGWSYYYDGLTAFYDTSEPIVLQQKISEMAAMLGLLSTQ
ncbi:MAG: hypothetical protein CEE40_05795 [Chloroflexi bacterium B3_Chlor]|nr:MAG: hypothetical protein CEE40_05795 [Chloroflexi bacterium B3_Chlor]